MLGFAFSEAQRSQELVMRLKSQQQQGPTGPPKPGQPPGTGGGHKRTRRRRRTKKSGAGGAGGGAAASRSVGNSIGPNNHNNNNANGARTAKQHDAPMTKRDLYFALRCGMVATGPEGRDSAVGRVTLVNWENQIVLDTFVRVPPEHVVDYRTEVTGITAELLTAGSALRFDTARTKVGNLIRGKILIGHGLEVDLCALGLAHPASDVRDAATYGPFMERVEDSGTAMMLPRALEALMFHVLRRGVNPDQPSLVREAIGCLDLYKHARAEWEQELIRVLQLKERQREMVLRLRSNHNPITTTTTNPHVNTGFAGPPQQVIAGPPQQVIVGPPQQLLTSINEEAAIREESLVGGMVQVQQPSVVVSGASFVGNPYHHHAANSYNEYDSYEDSSAYGSSIASDLTTTVASTEPTAASMGSLGPVVGGGGGLPAAAVVGVADDASEASSFFTHDTEAADSSSFFRLRRHSPEVVPSQIENLSQLEISPPHDRSHVNMYNTAGSSTAHGSHGRYLDDPSSSVGWSGPLGDHSSAGADSSGLLWTPLRESSARSSVASADWSHESPAGAPALAVTYPVEAGHDKSSQSTTTRLATIPQTPPTVAMTEEELMGHLPSQLLEAMENDAAATAQGGGVNKQGHICASPPEKKKGWLAGLRPVRRNGRASSGGTKDGSTRPLSSSDRTRRHGNLTPDAEQQEWLDACPKCGTSPAAEPPRAAAKPPPGFRS